MEIKNNNIAWRAKRASKGRAKHAHVTLGQKLWGFGPPKANPMADPELYQNKLSVIILNRPRYYYRKKYP